MSILLAGINAIALAFNGKEIQSLKELVMVKGFITPDINKLHTIVQGIVAKTQIAFAKPLYKVSKLNEACDATFLANQAKITEKFWDPKDIHVPFEMCFKDLQNTFFQWGLKLGKDRGDLTATDAVQFVLELLRNAMLHDLQRIAWHGDTAVLNVSAGGKLKNTESVTDYNHFNGFWKQIFASVTANPGNRVTIAQNAEATYALQNALPTDTAYNTFLEMYEKANSNLSSNPDAVIYCTKKMFFNYRKTLASKAVDASFNILVNGVLQPAFYGVPVEPMSIWDDSIIDFDNGIRLDLPNRALFTIQENIQLGVDSLSSLGEFNVTHENRTNTVVMRSGYKADAVLMEDQYTVAAY